MSVPNQTPYIIYNANGLTTVFPFEFYVISAPDIQVTINGESITTGYTVSGTGNVGGGDVIFLTPPANGSIVMLERVVPTFRLTDYQDNGDLLADTVNKDFDRLWMAIQRYGIHLGLALRRPLFGGPYNAERYRISQLGEPQDKQDAVTKNYVDNVSLVRALRVPESAVALLPAVDQRANKLLAFNASGQPITVLPASGSASDVMIELAKPTGAGMIGYQNPEGSSVATTVARKLRNTIDLAADFVPGGVITGQPDLTANLQAAIVAAHTLGIPEVTVVGDFFISKTVLLYPGVTLKGGGYDKTLIRCADSMAAGTTMFRSVRPMGWSTGCHNVGIKDIYLVGRTAKDIIAVDINDASYYKFSRVRTDLFAVAWDFNRWIDDTRVTSGGVTTYPNAHNTMAGGQCYFGVFKQCSAIDCIRAIRTAGIVNRQTEISCTWASCELAYDFSNPRGVYETNTYISTNVEGCKAVWEWFFSINSPYNNTWITLSIDNSNDFQCLAKDPGRQTFINLSLFPFNDSRFVSFYGINPDGIRSTIIGSNWKSNDVNMQTPENLSREPIHALNGFFNKKFGTLHVKKTFAVDEQMTYGVPIDGLTQGVAFAWSSSKAYPTLNISIASITAGQAALSIWNGTASPVDVDADFYVTPLGKSYY